MMACHFYHIIIMMILFYLASSIARGGSVVNDEIFFYNITCLNESQSGCQNESLDSIAASITNQTDVQIDIKVSWIQLKDTIFFENITSLTVNGDRDSGLATTIVCTMSGGTGAGIVFRDVTGKVELNHLKMRNCGSKIKTKDAMYLSALTIVNCRNVEITSSVIEKSNGIGLMIESYQGDRVVIKSTIFKENSLQQYYYHDNNSYPSSNSVYGGGGVCVTIQSREIQQQQCLPTVVTFDDCTFERNSANRSYYEFLYKGEVHKVHGRGGGAYVLLKRHLNYVNVTFIRSMFIGNHAYIGGGLAVRIFQVNSNIRVTIMDTVFEGNGNCADKLNVAKQALEGGGVHLTFDAYFNDSNVTKCHYTLKNVRFLQNCAKLGGGLYHFSGTQVLRGMLHLNTMLLGNCTFEGNRAHLGAAAIMAPSINRRILNGHSILVKFQDCSFIGNNWFPSSLNNETKITGWGTVYISSYDVHFLGHNTFENNFGSALYVVNGVLNFQESNVRFYNNTSHRGGAIALLGSSLIIFGPNSYEFLDNRALYKGGALYVSMIDKFDFIDQSNCFAQFVDKVSSAKWRANITFAGNKANNVRNGHSIYATSLRPCEAITIDNDEYNHAFINNSEVFTRRGMTFSDGKNLSQIATDAAMMENTITSSLKIIPGERHNLGVVVTNDLRETINTSFWAIIPNEAIQLDSTYSTLITDKISVKGVPGQSSTLTLNIQSPRDIYINKELEILECPPGFILKNMECVCNTDALKGLLTCDLHHFQSHLIPGYWAGYINSTDSVDGSRLVTSVCPFCYSNLNSSKSSVHDYHVTLPRNNSELSKTVCGDKRTGIACGKCREGYTVHFHSPGFLCKPAEPAGCKLGWLFYILSELVPVTVVFITVLVLNISFTSGAVNGFILFSQLLRSLDITAGGTIMIPDNVQTMHTHLKQVHNAFYGLFNLEYFYSEYLSFCLWKNASALDMIAVKYITILYTILLTVSVIWIMNRCGARCLGKYCRITTIKTSVIHGISTFLMICYAQCVNTSLSLLLQVHIYAAEGSDIKPHKRVWLNGELEYFSKEHLPYALPALFFLLTIGFLPPALLLAYPFLNKLITALGIEDRKCATLITRMLFNSNLKPLLDSFQGCFKDNFRFFAGLYFLYRWFFLLIHINTVGYLAYYTNIGAFLVIILTLHTICQPYIKRIHNIIDALLLCNLVLISSLSLSNFHSSNRLNPKLSNTAIHSAVIEQLVLIYTPAIAILVYTLFVICKQLKTKRYVNINIFCEKGERKLSYLLRSLGRCPWNKSFQIKEINHDNLTDQDDDEFMSVCDYMDQRDVLVQEDA